MQSTKNTSTPAFTINGDWTVQSKSLKKAHPQLTDSDLKFESGKENDLIKRVESRLNKNREQVIGILQNAQPKNV